MDCGREEEGFGPNQNYADLFRHTWALLMECAEKTSGLNVKHVKARRTGKENKAMRKERTYVMEVHVEADELVKEGADVNWRPPKPE